MSLFKKDIREKLPDFHEIFEQGLINEKYFELAGSFGVLGAIVSPHQSTSTHLGMYRKYAHGVIYYSATTGAHEVHGAIFDKWLSMGAELSILGFPVTDTFILQDDYKTITGQVSEFQHGAIYWSSITGAHEVLQDFYQRIKNNVDGYSAMRHFGYPVSGRENIFDGGQMQKFQYAQIYSWPDTGIIYKHGIPLTEKPAISMEAQGDINFGDPNSPFSGICKLIARIDGSYTISLSMHNSSPYFASAFHVTFVYGHNFGGQIEEIEGFLNASARTHDEPSMTKFGSLLIPWWGNIGELQIESVNGVRDS